MNNLLKILSFLMIFYSLFLLIIGIRNSGPIFLILLSVILLFSTYTSNNTIKLGIYIFFIIYIFFMLIFISVLYKNVKYENEYGAKQSEYIVVLGSGLKNGTDLSIEGEKRMSKALEYSKKYPHLKIFLTGGQGIDEKYPESLVMEKYLLEKGVPKDKILIETKSKSTNENIKFFLEKLSDDNITPKNILIVTSDFHMPRARIIAEHYGLNVHSLCSSTRRISFLTNIIREELAYIKTYIFDLK